MLNFLTKLPDRYLLIIGFLVTMGFYALYQVDAILQLMINWAVAIIALSQKKSDPTTAITADTVETPAVHADVMPDAVVNAETFNVKDDKKK